MEIRSRSNGTSRSRSLPHRLIRQNELTRQNIHPRSYVTANNFHLQSRYSCTTSSQMQRCSRSQPSARSIQRHLEFCRQRVLIRPDSESFRHRKGNPRSSWQANRLRSEHLPYFKSHVIPSLQLLVLAINPHLERKIKTFWSAWPVISERIHQIRQRKI